MIRVIPISAIESVILIGLLRACRVIEPTNVVRGGGTS